MSTHSDLIIIGAGPGGYETALEAAARGMDVTLVNGNLLGGTCLNEGCIPTKCMVKDAAVADTCRNALEFGVKEINYEIDFNKVIERREAVVSQLRSGVDALLKKAKVRVVEGKASFKNSTTIEVGGEEYDADNIIIATGSSSKALPIENAEAEWVLDSSKLLKLEYVPESLVIVGGGVIGMEFASVFASFGTEVTVVEFMKQILLRSIPTSPSVSSRALRSAA